MRQYVYDYTSLEEFIEKLDIFDKSAAIKKLKGKRVMLRTRGYVNEDGTFTTVVTVTTHGEQTKNKLN